MDPATVLKRLPPLKNLTAENITDNVMLINAQNPDARFKFVLERLVSHLHDFARETCLSTAEWMQGIEFLTRTGKTCTDVRQEFILLSDILGLSLLVDSIDHPKPAGSTDGTVLGPFHTHEAPDIEHGSSIMHHDTDGTPCLVLCTVKDSSGKPVEGCKIDIWETDSAGFYDVQRPDHKDPDGRCIIHSASDGTFWFKGIVPVSYPIPHDGPVGQLLLSLKRHAMRPAHMHFMFEKPGYDHLITALYIKGDPYESSDAVFGVKDSLIVELGEVDEVKAQKYGVEMGTALLEYDFVLITEQESSDLRNQNSIKSFESLGMSVKFDERGLPVPNVD